MLGIGAIVALRWRRRWPVTVAVVCVVATAASAMAVPAALLAVVSLVSSRGWRSAAVVAALGSVAALPYRVVRPESADDLSWWASSCSPPWRSTGWLW